MSHTFETQCRSSNLKGVLVRFTCSSWRGGGQRGLTLWTEILAVATGGLLLLLLSCFSRVQLCANPETAAYQAPLSLGFSRQEHWSGLPFPSPMHETEKWKWSHSVVSDSSRPPGLQPTRLLRPWDFQGKSTGVGCHCLQHIIRPQLTSTPGTDFLDSWVSGKSWLCYSHLTFLTLPMEAAPSSFSGTCLHGFPMTQGLNIYINKYSRMQCSEALCSLSQSNTLLSLWVPLSAFLTVLPTPFLSGYQLSILAATSGTWAAPPPF